jgi:S1-C subfamily serine protease
VTPSPTIGPAPAAAPAPAIVPATGTDAVLARREVDAALADFGALSVAFRASFTPAGLRVDSVLEGSLFSKAGLRAGDVIASVDGRPLRSLDDAASLYARAGSLRTVTAQIVRGGKTLTLRALIQ